MGNMGKSILGVYIQCVIWPSAIIHLILGLQPHQIIFHKNERSVKVRFLCCIENYKTKLQLENRNLVLRHQFCYCLFDFTVISSYSHCTQQYNHQLFSVNRLNNKFYSKRNCVQHVERKRTKDSGIWNGKEKSRPEEMKQT